MKHRYMHGLTNDVHKAYTQSHTPDIHELLGDSTVLFFFLFRLTDKGKGRESKANTERLGGSEVRTHILLAEH